MLEVDDELLAAVVAAFYSHLSATEKWRLDALCLEHPEISWVPRRGEPTHQALEVCARCAVRTECADFAVSARPAVAGRLGWLDGS